MRWLESAALAKLDDLADGADFLVGHNLIDFDLPHLPAVNPRLRLLRRPAVDTLRLNPLAFPRNPYHHLVKHYQDGQLKRGRINDPKLDCELALELFRDQQQALQDANPDLLTSLALADHSQKWSGIRSSVCVSAGFAPAVRRRSE